MAKLGRVLNKRVDGVPTGAKYVGRGTPHGNRFVIGRDGDRDEVCDKHDLELARDRTRLKGLDALTGYDCVCHCWPLRCHAMTLVKLAAVPFEERLVWALRTIAQAEAKTPPPPVPGRRQVR